MDVLRVYQQISGPKVLYDWQRECLEDERLIRQRHNFILWLPTGAGKTLVAELLLLREALVRKRNCLLILPYVAIVKEKIASLAIFEERLGIIVEEYAASKGRFPPIRRRNSQSIFVCTIEKANALVNSLIEQNRMNDELGLVVVDELHMLGESGGRGAVLEQCLCKLMHSFRSSSLSASYNETRVQIVGMSATLGNAPELCKFLQAEIYRTHFRPVRLVERVKLENKLFTIDGDEENWQLEREVPRIKNLEKRDPDGLVTLLGNLIKGQVLIFCPTKPNCENVCRMLATLSPKELREYRSEERNAILAQLREEHEGQICPTLSVGIPSGIAYHHSGLTQDERQLIENAYKSGVVSVICCTSTLAAGVNLPARRVIIRSPYVGRDLLKKSQYLQMVGRAGRAGLDEKGDSIVILHHGKEAATFQQIRQGPIDPCLSGMNDELQREAFFLDLIVLKICTSKDKLHWMFSQTLYGVQNQDGTDEAELLILTEKTIQSLLTKEMLIQTEKDQYHATQTGKATFNANFSPQMALDISRDLTDNLGQGIVLSSHFHLLYNCVPLDVDIINVDWNVFHNEFTSLAREERQLVNIMGFPESIIIQYILSSHGLKNLSSKAVRLYVAFMLRQVWNGRPLWKVAEYFCVPRGWLQSVMQSAVSQSSAIVRFADKIPNLWSIRCLLPEMAKRLSECSCQELFPLLALDCVKFGRARQLYQKGYRTIGVIARTDPDKLVAALDGKLNQYQARRMVNSAKIIIRDQIAEKTEELEQLGVAEGFILLSGPSTTVIGGEGSQKKHASVIRRSGLEPEEEEDGDFLANTPSSTCTTIDQ